MSDVKNRAPEHAEVLLASKLPAGEGPPLNRLEPGNTGWQRRWYEVIFESETSAGKWFDVALLVFIMLSIVAVMLESVASIQPRYGSLLAAIEWGITLIFSLEYLARLACVARPSRYALSFFGIVDVVSILPSYLALFFSGAHTLATVRTLRLLRVFRVLKMARHLKEATTLLTALKQTWPKITVFLTVIFCSIVIMGTVMYLIEGQEDSGFVDIPTSVYWAIVTMTTVGYGDIAPVTPLGKFMAAMIMLFGYAIIIVPTGLFSAEVISGAHSADKRAADKRAVSRLCEDCGRSRHDEDAQYCAGCGSSL
ncbi:ion transporter [Botrimarina hoheduenensis]|nr:ion transporter [Botrimarina hoheduenensis]